MKTIITLLICWLSTQTYGQKPEPKINPKSQGQYTLTKEQLKDKIMGGWAGQTIGVTFGGPYEFRFQGTFIGDYQTLPWYDGYIKETMLNNPGLYDDLYMDLTFVDVFERLGLNAPVDSFASAITRANYPLWHANQAGRYNILNNKKAPNSGHWKNNPHADCIDYQIEADFAGLMSPGMCNTASEISDKIGHIMNYGDGWYGGVYIGAMYSLAFVSNDVNYVVEEGLKTVPKQSRFYKCIADVIAWHKKHPDDWKSAWMEVQRKWAEDISCPDGVFSPTNIDATVNAAYVVIGLLYGQKDYTRTLEITTRCGQDADCNPSSSGGILGTLLGYKKIPAFWKMGLAEAEELVFKYTNMSLKTVYVTGYKHALENIQNNGGIILNDAVSIKTQIPKAVQYEQSFQGIYPITKIPAKWSPDKNEINFQFEGTGFVLRGDASKWEHFGEHVFDTELIIDGKLAEKIKIPVHYNNRRTELAWQYDLPNGKHFVQLKILNPGQKEEIKTIDVVIYSNKAAPGYEANAIKATTIQQ